MSLPNIVGLPPNIFRILNTAMHGAMVYNFATKAEAIRARQSIYKARKRFRTTGHPLVPAFDTLSITMPKERQRDDGATEWYWRIGESLIFEQMEEQRAAECEKRGVDPTTFDPPSATQPSFDPLPSIPLAPAAVRNDDTSKNIWDKMKVGAYTPPPASASDAPASAPTEEELHAAAERDKADERARRGTS